MRLRTSVTHMTVHSYRPMSGLPMLYFVGVNAKPLLPPESCLATGGPWWLVPASVDWDIFSFALCMELCLRRVMTSAPLTTFWPSCLRSGRLDSDLACRITPLAPWEFVVVVDNKCCVTSMPLSLSRSSHSLLLKEEQLAPNLSWSPMSLFPLDRGDTWWQLLLLLDLEYFLVSVL